MADFHAADLWVAVVPETSQVGPAMEKAGQEAKTSFGRAVKDFGKTIHDDLDKIGDKAKDSFGKAGRAAGQVFSTEIGSTIRTEIGGAFRDIGDAFRSGNITGAIDGINNKMSGIEDLAKNVGINIAGWKLPAEAKADINEFDAKAVDVLKNITGTSSQFADLPGKIGTAATAMSKFGGEIAIAVSVLETIGPTLDKIDQKIHDSSGIGKWIEDHSPAKLPQWLADHLGADKSRKFFGNMFGYDPDLGHTPKPGNPLMPDDPTDEWDPAWGPKPKDKGLGWFAPDGGKGSGYSSGWDRVAQAESGGNWKINTGNGYYGGLQFDQNTWNDFGGRDFAPRPDLATSDQQKAVADRVPVSQRAGRWPNTYKNFGAGGSPGTGSMAGLAGGLNLDTIPIAAQKYANDCIDASARIILSHSGVNMSEDQLKGVIAPGGTIESQAAGLNRLAPQGKFMAMPGSGGSPAAMFKAIKASIDQGVGSILNVAPGSSIAGHNFADGHFIAATGYNPDGTINLSDTARGTKYSVSAADAFQATRGRGIVAGTGSGPGAGSGGTSGPIPTGAEHDPLYVTQASGGSGGGGGSSPLQSQGQQLGQGLLGGLMQSVGLDGSVFGGKSPMDFGAVKLGSGLLNYGMGLMNSMAPGRGGGGGGLGGLAGLIPGPGAAISAASGPGGGSFGIKDAIGGGPTSIHHDNSVTVNGPFNAARDGFKEAQFQQNAAQQNPPRSNGILSGVPQGS